MGFEPFSIPKREVTSQTSSGHESREDKVRKLAELLHKRGLTSSVSDARRLAEGMVETEKKVMDQSQKMRDTIEQKPSITSSTNTKAPNIQPYHAKFEERFEKFIIHSMHIKDDEPIQNVKQTNRESNTQSNSVQSNTSASTSINVFETNKSQKSIEQIQSSTRPLLPKAIVYDNKPRYTSAEIPHTERSKQLFYEDAPSLTQARGYKGPQPQKIEYFSQKLEQLKAPPKAEIFEKQTVVIPVSETIELVQNSSGVEVTKVESAPNATIVEQVMIVKDIEPESIFDNNTADSNNPLPADTLELPVEDKKVEPVQEPVKEQYQEKQSYQEPIRQTPTSYSTQMDTRQDPAPTVNAAPQEKKKSEDLPKVDIFEFFRKKG